MSNGSANSHVSEVNLDEKGNVILTVQFNGFTSGERVEISGNVTQLEGAYSTFYYYTDVPSAPNPSSGLIEIPVPIGSMKGLHNQADITVVTKVAKVWPTVLKADKTNPLTPISTDLTAPPPDPIGPAKWNADPPPPWAARW
jgi:hypothetical protein